MIVQILFGGGRSGIPCKISDKKWFILTVANGEMLCIYSILISNDDSVINYQADILDNLLPFSFPWTFCSDIMEYDNRSNNILY